MPKKVIKETTNEIIATIDIGDPPKVKRARRTKKEIEEMNMSLAKVESTIEQLETHKENIIVETNLDEKPAPKKRGRKPKGGKIVSDNEDKQVTPNIKPNVILHLKCFISDLSSTGNHEPDFSHANVNSYDQDDMTYHVITGAQSTDNLSAYHKVLVDSDNTVSSVQPISNVELSHFECHHNTHHNRVTDSNTTDSSVSMKETWKKLKNLEQFLHTNSVPDSKSACFWCTYDFDNPPIYIPKFLMKETYHVYGCFCSPECAVGYLMNETIDSSCKFERYSLLNNLYNRVFEYKKNIKPAPDPHYFLERFCGNLTIQEYRRLLNSDRLFLVVDKPLTRILPELHEDNDEFIINNKIIPTSSNYNLKKKARMEPHKSSSSTKESVAKHTENFGIFSMVANQ